MINSCKEIIFSLMHKFEIDKPDLPFAYSWWCTLNRRHKQHTSTETWRQLVLLEKGKMCELQKNVYLIVILLHKNILITQTFHFTLAALNNNLVVYFLFITSTFWFASHNRGFPFGKENIANAAFSGWIWILHVVRHLIWWVYKIRSEWLFKSLKVYIVCIYQQGK